MERLPLELVERIFLNLRIQQKLECMLVCHYWYEVIQTTVLFHTINMNADSVNHGNLKKLMHRLKEEQTYCSNVKRLVIEGTPRERFELELEGFSEDVEIETTDAESFFECFGNLNLICLKHFLIVSENETRRDRQENVVKIHNKITTIIEIGCNSYSSQLLGSGICTQLVSLTVNFRSILGSSDSYFSILSNAPNLLKLALTNIYLSIDLLETIHNNLKKLETLDMKDVFIPNDYNGTILFNIVPTTCLKTFFLQLGCGIMFSDITLLDYVKRKHKSLEHFGFLYDPNAQYSRLEHDLPNFIAKGLIPLLEQFGHQLKTLKTSFVAGSPNIIATLDQFDCKLQSLIYYDINEYSAFNTLYQSNQHKHVQKLDLTGINDINPNIYGICKLVGSFTCLVKLSLGYSSDLKDHAGIRIDYFLDSCPDTLETLTLSFTYLYFDATHAISEKIYTLKKLKLHDVALPDRFDKFLSSNCKHLRHLIIFENEVIPKRSLNLPGLRLCSLNVTIPTGINPQYISITTLNVDKSYKYLVLESTYEECYLNTLGDQHGAIVYNTIPKHRCESCDGEICFEVECESLDTLIINAQIAF